DLPAFGRVDETPASHGGFAADGLEGHADHTAQCTFDHDLAGIGRALARLRQHRRPKFRPRPRRGDGAHAPGPLRGAAWRSVPNSSLKMAPRRVSRRASMRDVALVIWHPPRAITGSSTIPQAGALSVGARFSRMIAASSGCR